MASYHPLFFLSALLPGLLFRQPVELRYRILPIVVPHANAVHVSSLNASGQVAGWYDTATDEGTISHAFLWQNGRLIELGTLPGDRNSRAMSINDQGQIVGNSSIINGPDHAFLWERGTLHAIPGFGQRGAARAINNRGQIIGDAYVDHYYTAALWDGRKTIALGIMHPEQAGIESVSPWAFNDRGQIVGILSIGCCYSHAVFRDKGRWQDLGDHEDPMSSVAAINARGEMIGMRCLSNRHVLCLLWTQGRAEELAFQPTAINDLGQVVGYTNEHAFLYENGWTMNLNAMISASYEGKLEPVAINNRSEVLCSDGNSALLLVPEPSGPIKQP